MDFPRFVILCTPAPRYLCYNAHQAVKGRLMYEQSAKQTCLFILYVFRPILIRAVWPRGLILRINQRGIHLSFSSRTKSR
jgi:hypothetical protein